MTYGESNGLVTDDVTWPWKANVMTPICLGPISRKQLAMTLATIVLLVNLLWYSTAGYPSDNLASCFCFLVTCGRLSFLVFSVLKHPLSGMRTFRTRDYSFARWTHGLFILGKRLGDDIRRWLDELFKNHFLSQYSLFYENAYVLHSNTSKTVNNVFCAFLLLVADRSNKIRCAERSE